MKIKIKDLLDAGIHFGHRKNRWNPKMSEYIFGHRNGIHIIDLINWLTGLKPISVYAVGNDKITKNTSFKKNSKGKKRI